MKVMYVSLVCWLFIVYQGFAVPERIPPDVIKTQCDGYLYADYPGVFDDLEGEGITVEAWIYLTDRPKDGNYRFTSEGRWIVLAKPGSYHVAITGRDFGHLNEVDDPEGFAWIEFGIEQATENSLSAEISGHGIAPEDFPLRRWVHFAHQIVVKQDGIHNIPFYDRKNTSGLRRRAMGRADAPVLIGGPKPVTLKNRWEWDKRFESMKG